MTSLRLSLTAILLLILPVANASGDDHVAVLEMNMMILPGTSEYLKERTEEAAGAGAQLVIVKLNTPGGMLSSTQEMIEEIFDAPIPIVIYVSPSGGTATSAGVFVTLAGHVAAMAPGTTIGAAHPVTGSGQDVQGDMREKVEQMAIAMVKSIAEQRGRNVQWAEKAVKESASITEREALHMGVIDLVASDTTELLDLIRGKEVLVSGKKVTIGEYRNLPRVHYEPSARQRIVNVLANPSVAALMWSLAAIGIAVELYTPGLILPGVVGVICLILGLAVSQVIPLSGAGILLLVLGGLMVGAELYVPSGVLGVGGVIAMIVGALYLVDVTQAPDLSVSLSGFLPTILLLGASVLFVAKKVGAAKRAPLITGYEGMVGMRGRALESFVDVGKILLNGEIWSASLSGEPVVRDDVIEVVGRETGRSVLKIKKAQPSPLEAAKGTL